MSLRDFALFGLATKVTASILPVRSAAESSQCRVLPGDSAWPSSDAWAELNSTVNGNLIAAVPIASVCHDDPFNNYDSSACTNVQDTYDLTELHNVGDPVDILNTYFKNYTCDPFTDRSEPCELGNLASYVIDVAGVSDIQAGIQFAKEQNVRLVIKNTGHDYAGKSTGKGGLTLWTHNLKSTEVISAYESSYYSGPAIKLGAGVEGFEAYEAANATGHRLVGGGCPTVGISGGYTQGGGHSSISSSYGMAADQVLEWEVVTMEGEHLVATPEANSDLYWALSGGGGGTYGVVVSMTVRMHADGAVGGATLTFNDSAVGNEAFWEAMGAFHVNLGDFVDAGYTFTYVFSASAFQSWIVTIPGAEDAAGVNAAMQPFLDDLEARGIPYAFQPTVFGNYFDHFAHYLGPLPEGIASQYAPFTGSKIMPRAVMADDAARATAMAALRNATLADGYQYLPCTALNVSRAAHPDNAVLPAWREALGVCLLPAFWDETATPGEMQARQDYQAEVLQPMVDAAFPGGAVYLNEANYRTPDWQRQLYGDNYDRLLRIKNKYDPDGLLYAHTAVGSDAWFEDGEQRLCRA
ncbi:FAD-binding domain-containing protein [Xylariomycetidae sp. FL0641]|nr:FAD-binding domain-containing protein [Xylariomycetidae sp. FL0641]